MWCDVIVVTTAAVILTFAAIKTFYEATFRLAECEAVLFYLLAAVDAVLAEDRSAACGHPHSSQRVAVNLVLLNHALALFMLEHGAESAVSHFRRGDSTNTIVISGFNSPRRCLRAARRGFCYAVRWGNCWFGSGFPPRRCHRYRYSLSNPVHPRICTRHLGYRWI